MEAGQPRGYPGLQNHSDLMELIETQNLAPGVFANLSSLDLAALRVACRYSRRLVDRNCRTIVLNFHSRAQLQRSVDQDLPGAAEERAKAEEVAQTSAWPAALEGSPPITTLVISVVPRVDGKYFDTVATIQRLRRLDLGEELLGCFSAHPHTAARVRRLKLQHDKNSVSGLELPASILPRIVQIFPSLTELELVGEWSYGREFYTALAEHLPHLRRLHVRMDAAAAVLSGRLQGLRELTLDNGPSTDDAVAALTTFPDLRVLRLVRVHPFYDIVRPREILLGGLAPSLESVEVWEKTEATSGAPYLQLIRTASATSEGGAGSGCISATAGGGGSNQRRCWDMVIKGNMYVISAAQAVQEASLEVGCVRIPDCSVSSSGSQLFRSCRRVVAERLVVVGGEEMSQLGEALQVLGPPSVLLISRVVRRGLFSQLDTLAGSLLAPRLTRLEVATCAGLTPAKLIATLAALPLCKEVVLSYCARFSAEVHYRELVDQLLALPGEAELRRRPVRLVMRGRVRRPLGGEETDDEGDGGYSLWKPHTGKGKVAWMASALVQRVVASCMAAEMNGVLERGGVAARLVLEVIESVFAEPNWWRIG